MYILGGKYIQHIEVIAQSSNRSIETIDSELPISETITY